MKRRTEIIDKDKYISKDKHITDLSEDSSDFYRRWYAKFGKPETITLPGDEFMQRLKEMVEFE